MDTKGRIVLYFGYKFILIFISILLSFNVLRSESKGVALFAIYTFLFIELIMVLLLNKINFFKRIDVEKTYVEFLEIFMNLQMKHLPRFIYRDFLFNFISFYNKNHSVIYKYDERFMDNYNYMHTLITYEKSGNEWISSKALYNRKWFCRCCELLLEAYDSNIYGNRLLLHMNELVEKKEEKRNKKKSNKQYNVFLKLLFIIFLSVINILCEDENIRNIISFILSVVVPT